MLMSLLNKLWMQCLFIQKLSFAQSISDFLEDILYLATKQTQDNNHND